MKKEQNNNESKIKCMHKNRKDLTQGLGDERHIYCPDCKWHLYKDREWSKEEWENYIENYDY